MRWLAIAIVAACGSAPPPRLVEARSAVASPGADPRELIRFHYAVHSSHRTHIETTITNTPPMAQTIDTEIESVEADGTAKVRATTVFVSVPDTASAAVREAVEKYRGQIVTVTMSPRGAVLSQTAVAGPAPGPDWFTRFGFPDEPIGVGATWDDTATIESQGVAITVVGHRSLVSRDGDTLVVHTHLTGHTSATHDDHTAEMAIVGDGDTTYHLSAPLATTGSSATDLTLTLDGRARTIHFAVTTTSP